MLSSAQLLGGTQPTPSALRPAPAALQLWRRYRSIGVALPPRRSVPPYTGIHIHLPAMGIHLRGLSYIITVAAGVGGGAVTSIGGMGLKKLIKALKDPSSSNED